jgi:biotin operon repressor/predicted nucleotidyltransferase
MKGVIVHHVAYPSSIVDTLATLARTASPLLLPLFRSQAQARLLARVYLETDRPAPLATIAAELGLDRAGVKREADRLEEAGLVVSSRVGRQRLLRPNVGSPYYHDLLGLLLTAFGPAAIIGPAFRDVEGIELGFLFGSWAARYEGERGDAPVDVDVLLVGSPDRGEVYGVARALTDVLGREVNPTIVSFERWESEDEGFIREVKSSALVPLDLKGNSDPAGDRD